MNQRFHQHVQTIAEYSQQTGLDTKCQRCQPLIWTDRFPVDTERTEIRRVMMGMIEIGLITGGGVIGIALAIFFLTFNIVHRRER